MNKRAIAKSLLILLPVLAVGLATTVDSVTVFDTVSGTTQYYSYFDPVPVGNLKMLPALAALLSALSGILAAVYLAKKNQPVLKTAGYAAFASAAVAAIPMLIRGDVLVVPNVALPIFMMLQFGVACGLEKAGPEKKVPEKAPRLKKH